MAYFWWCKATALRVNWCAVRNDAFRIWRKALADAAHTTPEHVSLHSVHQHNAPFAEFLMMHPTASEVVPMFAPQLLGEPVPINGSMKASMLEKPGFGVELNPDIPLYRPYEQ